MIDFPTVIGTTAQVFVALLCVRERKLLGPPAAWVLIVATMWLAAVQCFFNSAAYWEGTPVLIVQLNHYLPAFVSPMFLVGLWLHFYVMKRDTSSKDNTLPDE